MTRFSKMAKVSRRQFLQSAALATAAPMVVPSSVFGRNGSTPPSERITMGLIGCGSHGKGWNLPLMFHNPAQQVVAVCDVDKNYVERAKRQTDDFYSKKFGTDYKACDAYGDFRDVVNRKDIDAVDIVTPDHWHVPMAVFAMKAGKDVICEKPTRTIKEGRLLSDTQKATQRVFQTASENRSEPVYQQIVNLARNGHLGEIRHIKVLLPPGNTMNRDPEKRRGDSAVQKIPDTLNYELWTGPAPLLPYIPVRHHYNWRWNQAYSGGGLPDWGSHMINIAQWVLDADNTGPVKVQGTGHFPPFDEPWNTAESFKLSYQYAGGVTMDVWSEVPGIKIEGTKGWVLSRGWRQPLTASNESLLHITFDKETNYGRPESTVQAGYAAGKPTKIEQWGGEHIDFTNCVKSRKLCYYSAESGHRTHTVSHIGNISMLLGGAELTWNPVTEMFEGERAEEANKNTFYSREQREPYGYDKIDSWINAG
ncbi:MAG: Gfo/Idh/MocA family oxidoreductase [Planctomycetaceae bacterium]|nr:Gfo/Idh/MocA family oxidoreductase [Planctomycetaceae bacterium]